MNEPTGERLGYRPADKRQHRQIGIFCAVFAALSLIGGAVGGLLTREWGPLVFSAFCALLAADEFLLARRADDEFELTEDGVAAQACGRTVAIPWREITKVRSNPIRGTLAVRSPHATIKAERTLPALAYLADCARERRMIPPAEHQRKIRNRRAALAVEGRRFRPWLATILFLWLTEAAVDAMRTGVGRPWHASAQCRLAVVMMVCVVVFAIRVVVAGRPRFRWLRYRGGWARYWRSGRLAIDAAFVAALGLVFALDYSMGPELAAHFIVLALLGAVVVAIACHLKRPA